MSRRHNPCISDQTVAKNIKYRKVFFICPSILLIVTDPVFFFCSGGAGGSTFFLHKVYILRMYQKTVS